MKKKIHNAILWTITYIMFAVIMISWSAFDSESIVMPVIGLFVSLGWLLVFSNVNKERW